LLAPLLSKWLGTPPDQFNSKLIDPDLGVPRGSFGGASSSHPLGVEPISGRDVFSRVVYGARVSLLVAVLSAVVSTIIGTMLGMAAGFLGGWVDTVISRLMDLLLAFPQLLFTIALISVVPDKILGIGGTGARLVMLVTVIGFFGWPYIGRIVRGQTLTLREREFVEASRSLGARSGYIISRELLPNLVAPILVYATLIIPANILTEAALSYLGVGVRPPTSSWGAMLSNATDYYQADPTYMVIPGVAIFITVLAFNLFGDGLRDALDPRSNR
jgi:peptide/nickel transport system permease protein